MNDTPIIYTSIAILPETKRKLAALAKLQRRSLMQTVSLLIEAAYERPEAFPWISTTPAVEAQEPKQANA